MLNRSKPGPQRPFVPPSPIVWDDARLNALDKEQLTNLLANVPAQLAIGRITEETASDLEQRIRSRLPAPSKSARQKVEEPDSTDEDTDAEHEEASNET